MQENRPPEDPPEERTAIGLPLTNPPSAELDTDTQLGFPLPASPGQLCEACHQPLEPGRLFCQACGAETSPAEQPPPPTRLPGWFPILVVGWFVVMVAALVLLYTGIFQVF
jgi:hypothetical protein